MRKLTTDTRIASIVVQSTEQAAMSKPYSAAPGVISEFLRDQPGKTASVAALKRQFGEHLPLDQFETFIVRPKDDWIKIEPGYAIQRPTFARRKRLRWR
jgi:hypothetical protein